MTIILVTHLMDDVANFADYVYVLEKGRIVKEGAPKNVFQDIEWLQEKQLGVPTATAFAALLQAKGLHFERFAIDSRRTCGSTGSKGGRPQMMNKLIFGRFIPGDSLYP